MQFYYGISNPSGAIALDKRHFIVADDEENSLRVYHKKMTDKPLQTIELKKLFAGDVKNGKRQEIDLEGAAELDGKFFWIGSHSSNRDGKPRPARHRLLAIKTVRDKNDAYIFQAEGEIYKNLIDDLAQDPRFDTYRFAKAGKIPPKDIGGLSIEGLAATRKQGLLIGFRNPLSGGNINGDKLEGGKALLINLLNPFEVIQGKSPRFADPIELDMQGLGIRDIVLLKKRKYLIAAGPYYENDSSEAGSNVKTRLYSWSSKSGKLKLLKKIDLGDLNIEAVFAYPGKHKHIQMLSDDGKRPLNLGFRSIRTKI